jgi:hypothetical protein
VSFLGNLVGQSQLGAEATLDLSVARSMPLRVELGYSTRGKQITAGDIARARGPVTVRMVVTNLTAAPRDFIRASAAPSVLAQVLENLRQVPSLYTPETDLQAQFPMPATIRAAPPTSVERHSVYVPLALTVTARLGAGAAVLDSGGADVVTDPRGDRLTWTGHLPVDPGSDVAQRVFTFTFTAAHPRLPGLEVKADPLPFPAAVFAPPRGGSWSASLAGLSDRASLTVLAQEGAASLHRIGELVQPLGRPGPGPVKVKYDFVVESGAVQPVAARPQPVRGQPVVILLAVIAGVFLAANGAWAWARH